MQLAAMHEPETKVPKHETQEPGRRRCLPVLEAQISSSAFKPCGGEGYIGPKRLCAKPNAFGFGIWYFGAYGWKSQETRCCDVVL